MNFYQPYLDFGGFHLLGYNLWFIDPMKNLLSTNSIHNIMFYEKPIGCSQDSLIVLFLADKHASDDPVSDNEEEDDEDEVSLYPA